MKQVKLFLVLLIIQTTSFAQPRIMKYPGAMMKTYLTHHQFPNLANAPNYFPATAGSTTDESATILIKGPNYATNKGLGSLIIDIGDNEGNFSGYKPFAFITFDFKSGAGPKYRRIEIEDGITGKLMTGRIGRCDGVSFYGPADRIYFLAANYLIEFDQKSYGAPGYRAKAYRFPQGFDPFVISCGPSEPGIPPLIYGGTSHASRVWWFNPMNPAAGIQYITDSTGAQPEIDGRQNYVNAVAGKGNWLYVLLRTGDYPGAYRSLYAINIVTQKKYLIFQTTEDGDFQLDRLRMNGVQDVYLRITGSVKGTLYLNPPAINMFARLPSNVGQNCPCYNIDHTAIGNRNVAFGQSDTSGQYGYLMQEPPRDATSKYICNPKLHVSTNWPASDDLVNLPGDLNTISPPLLWPVLSYTYIIRLDREKPQWPLTLENQFGSTKTLLTPQTEWKSYDPIKNLPVGTYLPQTHWWDTVRTLEYTQPGVTKNPTIQVGFYSNDSASLDLNGIKQYQSDLTGLAMTGGPSANYPTGSTTLVKGIKKEGIGAVYVNKSKPWGYTFSYHGRSKSDDNGTGLLPLGEIRPGNFTLGTHMISVYPGEIQLYNYGKNLTSAYDCYHTSYPAAVSCNPRIISKMYPLQPPYNSPGKVGPEIPVGARLYYPDYFNGSNSKRYKIIYVGQPGRARQALDVVVGIHDFIYSELTGVLSNQKYTVIDKDYTATGDHRFMGDFSPVCISNEAVGADCADQRGGLGRINAPYNRGIGYSFSSRNNPSCPDRFLKMIISSRRKDGTGNELWVFDPAQNKIISRYTTPGYDYEAITNITPIGDFYIAQCGSTLILFKLDGGGSITVIDYYSSAKNRDLNGIKTFTVTPGQDGLFADGNIAKIFVSCTTNSLPWPGAPVPYTAVVSLNIRAEMQRKTIYFEKAWTRYPWDNQQKEEINDFAYVPDTTSTNQDLLMIGRKSLYKLSGVVPHERFVQWIPRGIKIPVNQLENTSYSSLDAYPNPFLNQISLGTSQLRSGTYNLSLADNTGKTIMRRQIEISSATDYKIDVPQLLATGIYILQISGKDISRSIKLLKY